jgi:hypothetical protein
MAASSFLILHNFDIVTLVAPEPVIGVINIPVRILGAGLK